MSISCVILSADDEDDDDEFDAEMRYTIHMHLFKHVAVIKRISESYNQLPWQGRPLQSRLLQQTFSIASAIQYKYIQ